MVAFTLTFQVGRVTVYSVPGCPHCIQAKATLSTLEFNGEDAFELYVFCMRLSSMKHEVTLNDSLIAYEFGSLLKVTCLLLKCLY
uniref:Glutaredoxin domain-containing protein n=1 Tax=Sinocyclocheilus grahami TaxID=75366 RepID=A0A672KH21_SINGR